LPRTFHSLQELREAAGTSLGSSGLVEVDQARIDAFAAATEDEQWIHVDPERAAAGPFGTTIAHGFLTLSLVPHLLEGLLQIEGVKMSINYGLNRVRFPAPVPAGSRLRATAGITSVEDVADGVQVELEIAVEREDLSDKPVCVASLLVRVLEN
jgi:acyl dehydratase